MLWIPFAIVHARKALYPQLDGPGSSTFGYANRNVLESGEQYSMGAGGVTSAVKMDEVEQQALSDESDMAELHRCALVRLRHAR